MTVKLLHLPTEMNNLKKMSTMNGYKFTYLLSLCFQAVSVDMITLRDADSGESQLAPFNASCSPARTVR